MVGGPENLSNPGEMCYLKDNSIFKPKHVIYRICGYGRSHIIDYSSIVKEDLI